MIYTDKSIYGIVIEGKYEFKKYRGRDIAIYTWEYQIYRILMEFSDKETTLYRCQPIKRWTEQLGGKCSIEHSQPIGPLKTKGPESFELILDHSILTTGEINQITKIAERYAESYRNTYRPEFVLKIMPSGKTIKPIKKSVNGNAPSSR